MSSVFDPAPFIGKQHLSLLVDSYHSLIKGHHRFNCICVLCGSKKIVAKGQLGRTKSCGCEGREKSSQRFKKMLTKHNRSLSSEYRTWDAMIQRCHNDNHKFYQRYGGRGITVCDRWRTFENFIEDMGHRPKDLTLDRIDNDKGYSKENCRWTDRLTQSENRKVSRLLTIGGESKCLSAWSRNFGLPLAKMGQLLKKGQEIDSRKI